ncbi:outer dense fiber of sperm tails 2, partial [Homo sapiens]
MSASSSGGSPRFPSCGKNGVTSLTQKKVLRAPCGAPSVTVTKSHKRGMKGDTVNVRRSVRVKTKNPPHCLEITPPSSEKLVSVMRLSDLSTEDDDSGHCKMNRYDKKIDSLMNAVGCLKSEVKMQKGERQMAKRFLEERKEELEEVAHELAETEHE